MMLDNLADAARRTSEARGTSTLSEDVWNEVGSRTRLVWEVERIEKRWARAGQVARAVPPRYLTSRSVNG